MNRTAYFSTDLAIKTLSKLLKAKTVFHNLSNIPEGPIIFVVNHFTRLETLLLPYYLFHLTKTHIWSLANANLFKGGLKSYFDKVGVVSTKDPERDKLIVKTLLKNEAHWIIFPEGRMVKTKKTIEKGTFVVGDGSSVRSPHTGAASLALRAELFRHYLNRQNDGKGKARIRSFLGLSDTDVLSRHSVKIVPVNLTYYPIRAHENLIAELTTRWIKEPSERLMEELMTEGTMLLDGVDIDMTFGCPLDAENELKSEGLRRLLDGPDIINFDDDVQARHVLQKKAGQMMQIYMERIYAGTTINHDHLYASLLRKRSFRPFAAEDLTRTVFLAAENLKGHSAGSMNLHSTLQENQQHLLVDDRYKQQGSFMDLALETGCLSRSGQLYRKNPSYWLRIPLFHKARIENPTEVMANELEPLKNVQKCIRLASLPPDIFNRVVISRKLYRKDRENYLKERSSCGDHAELEEKDGRPYILPAWSRRAGVVLVHSYLSVPRELLQCARMLRAQGVWVYGVRLPGHGSRPEILAETTWQEWSEAVERGFAIINQICRDVVLVGFSAGGSLVMELASRLEKLAGVVAICPPNSLKDYSKRFMPPVDIWNRILIGWKGNLKSQNYVDFKPEEREINYKRNPVASVYQVGKLLDTCRDQLPRLSHRSLVVVADKDQVVANGAGQKVYMKIGSVHKELAVIPSERHNIVSGPDGKRTREIITSFVVNCFEK